MIDYLTSKGLDNTPKRQRLFWAITEGVVAASLRAEIRAAPDRNPDGTA